MFTLTVRLGRGRAVDTFAAVLEAEGERMDVIVKKPSGDLADNAALIEAFELWGRKQLEVEADHIVAVLENGRTDDGPYVILERIEGADLATVLAELKKKKRSLRPHLAVGVAKSIAEGLKELHDRGVVHGSLTPSDVLVGYDGEVQLRDQGLWMIDASAGLEAPRDSLYLPPEQKNDTSAPTLAGDIYALALVTIEMLLGFPAWQKMPVESALQAVTDFSPLGTSHPDLAKQLIPLLLSCLSDDSSKRPVHGGVVFEKLKELIADFDIVEKPSELGAFVRAAVPMRKEEDAPTMIASAPPPPTENKHDFKVATMAINEELLNFLAAEEKKKAREAGLMSPDPAPRAPSVQREEVARASSKIPIPVRAPERTTVEIPSWLVPVVGGTVFILFVLLLARC